MFVISKNKVPIKIWAEQQDVNVQPGALTQATNLANHPLVSKWVCLMPDFHQGFGMPIGGVIAVKNGVIPNAVGVDIGCGMIAMRTHLTASELSKDFLQKIRLEIHKRIPVGGGGKEGYHTQKQNHPYLTIKNAQKMGVDTDPVIPGLLDKADYQIGTLGGGNHFIEIQKDQDEAVWIMLHSGSRGVGKKVCDYYHAKALDYCEKFHAAIPDKDLAFLPVGVPEYQKYISVMKFAMGFAEASRKSMLNQVIESFKDLGIVIKSDIEFETHHNFAAMENHYGENYMIHRKGAVKAENLVTIPGSMGTASYICEGLKPKESFNSCSHGAGRLMGRSVANKTITMKMAQEAMKDVVFGIRDNDFDEMPQAYKDIERIIEQQQDLVKPVYRLVPLAVAKG